MGLLPSCRLHHHAWEVPSTKGRKVRSQHTKQSQSQPLELIPCAPTRSGLSILPCRLVKAWRGTCCAVVHAVAASILRPKDRPRIGCNGSMRNRTRQIHPGDTERRSSREHSGKHSGCFDEVPPTTAMGGGIIRMLYWSLAPGAERDPRPRVPVVHTTVATGVSITLSLVGTNAK